LLPCNRLQTWAATSCAGPLLAMAFIIVNGFDIMSYPLVGFDEVLLNDAGRQLVTTGQFRAEVLSQNPGFESHYFWQPPALPLAAAAVYRLLGFGLWQTRVPSILFGGLAIWAIFSFVRYLRPNGLAATIAALTLFFWPTWMLTTKTSRMDSGAILTLLLATHLVMRAAHRGAQAYWQTFAAGTFGGAALMFHTAAGPWVLALGITILMFLRQRLRLSLIYGCGVICVVALWLIYATRYPEQFQAQYLEHLFARSAHEGMVERFSGHAKRYWNEFHGLPTLFVMLLLSTCLWTIHRLRDDRPLLVVIVLAGWTVIFTAITVGGRTAGCYTMYPLTLAFCAMAIVVEDAVLRDLRRGRRWVASAIGFCTMAMIMNAMALSLGPRLLAVRSQADARNYALQTAPLTERLRPGDQIWGAATLWYAAVKASARLQVLDWVPPYHRTRPDPRRHIYVAVDRGDSFPGMEAYVKLVEFGSALPKVMGSPLSDKSYEFDLWQSRESTTSH
jgi:4-amino-4-deoxy-L-arabinose transferase-like glycosyltransferase